MVVLVPTSWLISWDRKIVPHYSSPSFTLVPKPPPSCTGHVRLPKHAPAS
jgi:hypothetical protein